MRVSGERERSLAEVVAELWLDSLWETKWV